MPVAGKLEEIVKIPEDVKVEQDGRYFTVSGPNGTLKRKLEDTRINIDVGPDQITLSTQMPSKREKALLGTYTSHLRNMIKGAQEDFVYKMRIVYSHFPMKVRAEGDEMVIENFIGEEKPRRTKIVDETKAEIQKDLIVLSGPNKEAVGQTAANIERATKIKGRDPRVFQDGIYIIEKAGRVLR